MGDEDPSQALLQPWSRIRAGWEWGRMGWCHGSLWSAKHTHVPTASAGQCHHCSPTSGPFSWISTVSLGSLGPALAGAAPRILESDGNIAACVGCPRAGNCLLPMAWHLQCPECHHVPHALVGDKSHSQGQCCREQWVPGLCSFPFSVFQTAKSSPFGLKRGFPGKRSTEVLLLTTSSCGFQCHQLNLILAS